MRSILSKLMTGSAVAGAALLVSACGGTETTNTTNTVVTDMNDMGMMDGTTTDNMTGIDGAMGTGNMMANDMMMNNMSTMNGMEGNMMMNNMAGNAM